MPQCDFCGKEVLLPFECKFCGGNFCVEHRLPENHSCPHASPRTPLGQWEAKARAPHEQRTEKKRLEPPIIAERDYCPKCHSYRKQAITYGEKFEIFECLECGFEWKVPERPSSHRESRRRSKLNVVLVLVTIGMIAVSSMVVGYYYPQIVRLENEKTNLQEEISNLQSEVSTLETELDSLKTQLNESYDLGYISGFYDGNETGFVDGYVQGVEDGAGTGYTVREPTYDEAIAFIAWDKTNENEYSENYTCHHFTADFKNNAFEAGYRCGYVAIDLPEELGHAIVCFNTTNYGVIFVEPQYDDIVTVTIGRSYSDINGYELPDYDDTIVAYTIIW